jgi:hypothetical protein
MRGHPCRKAVPRVKARYGLRSLPNNSGCAWNAPGRHHQILNELEPLCGVGEGRVEGLIYGRQVLHVVAYYWRMLWMRSRHRVGSRWPMHVGRWRSECGKRGEELLVAAQNVSDRAIGAGRSVVGPGPACSESEQATLSNGSASGAVHCRGRRWSGCGTGPTGPRRGSCLWRAGWGVLPRRLITPPQRVVLRSPHVVAAER